MEIPAARSAVAGSGKGHARLSPDLECECGAGCDRQVVGQVADESDHPPFQITHVYVAVFAFGGTGLFAEILGDDFTGREPANQKGSHIAMKGAMISSGCNAEA